jgi:BRCA1-associated protein
MPACLCLFHRHNHRRHGGDAAVSGGGCSAPGHGGGGGGGSGAQDSEYEPGCPACEDEARVKDVIVSSKLDAITLEYNHLLTTQLDSQRQYFEGVLAAQEARSAAAVAAAQATAADAAAARDAAAAAVREADRRRQQLERKVVRVAGCVISSE